MNDPQSAIQALRAALYLDPLEQSAQQQFLQASAAARGQKIRGGGGSGGILSGGVTPAPGE